MFYYLCGDLVLTAVNTAVIDVGGVGYSITVSGTTLGKIAGKSGKTKLFTYLKVSEDAVELFGFATEEELSMFKLLLAVSGVGPKAAISVLSLYSPDKLAAIIANEDVKAIAKAQNIGGKTAARIVLELKDKLKLKDVPAAQGNDFVPEQTSSVMQEATNALLVLGYTRAEAAEALRRVGGAPSLEELITAALKQLAKG